jgi:hypothetical protein
MPKTQDELMEREKQFWNALDNPDFYRENRGLAARCGSCWKVLMDAGSVGRKRKASAERWWLGNDVGKKSAQE